MSIENAGAFQISMPDEYKTFLVCMPDEFKH